MTYLTRDQVAARSRRARVDFESPVLGGTLCLQELGRWDWRVATKAAEIPGEAGRIYIDLWHIGIFTRGVVDPATGEPLFTQDDLLTWRNSDALWAEVARIADAILSLSEVGPDSLKSGDPPADGG